MEKVFTNKIIKTRNEIKVNFTRIDYLVSCSLKSFWLLQRKETTQKRQFNEHCRKVNMLKAI